LAKRLGLQVDDIVVDLGAGTGQLTIPLQVYCALVVAVDPEPAMLERLRRRDTDRVVCVLDDDRGLGRIGRLLGRSVGAVVIGNALHWMNEAATMAAATQLLRPGGGMAIVTQGPPLWWGDTPWQSAVRTTLEEFVGPVTELCRTDDESLLDRRRIARDLGLAVDITRWAASYTIDREWIIGHLASATSAGQLTRALCEALHRTMDRFDGEPLTEQVVTTALVARR